MSSNLQQLNDIEIPDIEISDGWYVSDIASIEDCDDAFALLTATVATIEVNLETSTNPDPTWAARARGALRYKKAALQIVQTKRGRFEREAKRAICLERDRLLLEHIKRSVPAKRFMTWVREALPLSELD